MENYRDECRICLQVVNNVKINISTQIQTEFFYLTGMELEESDEFSNFLCSDCFICLTNCFKFKSLCVENQKILKEKLNETDKKIESLEEKKPVKIVKAWKLIKLSNKGSKIRSAKVGSVKQDLNKGEIIQDQDQSKDEPVIKSVIIDNYEFKYRVERKIKRKKAVPVPGQPPLDKDEVIECDYCFKSVKRSSMRRHILLVHEKKAKGRFICESCGRRFIFQSYLMDHLQYHLPVGQYLCDLCGAIKKTKQDMRTHMSTIHLKQYEVICQICGIKKSNKHQLADHINSQHSQKSRYICDLCGKGFSNKIIIKTHLQLVHFCSSSVCKLCKSEVKHMDLHMKSHTKPHKCTFILDDGTTCPNAFSIRYSLRKHINIVHRNVKPYHCKRCFKEFNTRNAFKEHILAEHYNLQLDCVIQGCRTKFRTKRALYGHIKVVHRELSEKEKEKYRKIAMKVPTPDIVN